MGVCDLGIWDLGIWDLGAGEVGFERCSGTLLQVKTENKKNEVEERRAEENLMLMILAGGRGRGQGSPILYIQTPDRPLQRLLLVIYYSSTIV